MDMQWRYRGNTGEIWGDSIAVATSCGELTEAGTAERLSGRRKGGGGGMPG